MSAVLGKMMEHVRLVSRMAQVTDTDLVAAYDAGMLSQEDWAGMVQTCRSCTWAGRCEGWLDSHDSVDQAPVPCLNRDRFAALRDDAGCRLTEAC
ncbi:DUF6455 family protein [Pseudodonghicola flavimaris]|uniref:DUF6455 family protein n=1 Tax=Pseudodonghicola flavimaris TaxID=3050036 RepID=A0ABT7EZ21_9RHOB|nr:DUF6455 family protein [Pseudodonghicola flavimaris]MDK3017504.1 DUF6455 family protein [Pseudodonghicola flavimaris]